MAFKMKGEPMKRNFGVGGPAKLKKEKEASPVKAMGNFEMNPATGEFVRVSSDFANRSDAPLGTTQTRTGEEATRSFIKRRMEDDNPMTTREVADLRRQQQKNLARYGGLSEKEASLANALDQSIQQKYNEGRAKGLSVAQIKNSLTAKEREFEKNTLDYLNQGKGGFVNK